LKRFHEEALPFRYFLRDKSMWSLLVSNVIMIIWAVIEKRPPFTYYARLLVPECDHRYILVHQDLPTKGIFNERVLCE